MKNEDLTPICLPICLMTPICLTPICLTPICLDPDLPADLPAREGCE